MLQHIAIIMDGNGRWAEGRGLPKSEGHRRGAEATRKIIEAAAKQGIPFLTLYAFSAENWNRPEPEVSWPMDLLKGYLRREISSLHQNNIRVRVVGDLEKLAADIRGDIEKAEDLTAGNTKLTLTVALSYGSRQEIVMAAKKIAESGEIKALTEEKFSEFLYTNGIPDPDLLIRTGGEKRLSNFLLWQFAYTELYFSDILWPDFGVEDLNAAIAEFAKREGDMEQDRQSSRQAINGDLKKRIVSGVALALPVLAIIYFGGAVFTLLAVAAALILAHEWKGLIAGENAPKQRLKLELLGIIYIALPATALIWLRGIDGSYGIDGRSAVFWVMLTVWATDIAGYFVGKKFGNKKLAPSISPNKTWNGAFGSLAAALVLAIILTPLMKPQHTVIFIAATLLMSAVSQAGDLLESWIKRKFGAKDSGSLIPGHGGLFDRVDGLMAAAVFAALLIGAGVFR